jgi:DNA-binding transcriptional LysR family regulator
VLNWDDLRVFGVASRSPSLAAAGQSLGMDASTVGRRILRLETQLKATLLVRSPTGLQLTRAGTELQEVTAKVEKAVASADRPRGAGPISGVVRVSLPSAMGAVVFAGRVLAHAARYPDLTIELAENNGDVDVAHGEADVALSSVQPLPGAGLMEEFGRFEIGLFADGAYLAAEGPPRDVADLARLRYVRCFGHPRTELASAEQLITDRLKPVLTNASLGLHHQMIKEGAGFGFLPVVMAKASGLERILSGEVRGFRALWLSASHEFAETARYRAVRSWLREAADATGPARTSSVVPFSPAAASGSELSRRRA